MKKLFRNSCIRIPKKHESELWVKEIIRDLTRTTESYSNKESLETKLYYEETPDCFLIPRFYPVHRYGFCVDEETIESEDISLQDNIQPRNSLQVEAIEWFQQNKNGILCMKPGEGKTVVAIKAICNIGKKAIVFVHKNDLGKQWIERITQHTKLEERDVGWLRSNSFIDDLSKPIVISTVQTYCSLLKNVKNFDDIIKNYKFGIAVWDESHTSVSAEIFSKTSIHTFTERLYGLSATPRRTDGNTDIMNMHLGDVFIPKGNTNTLQPRSIMIYFDHKVSQKYKYVINQLYLDDDNKNKGQFNKGVYLSKLIKSKEYIHQLKRIVQQVVKSDRNALFLSDRINVLKEIMSIAPENKCGLFIGSTDSERNNILSKQIIFSTYQKSRDGLDVPRLDCVVFCTPVSNIEQAVGRILRPFFNKKDPVIIDLVDTGSQDIFNRSKYRKKFYMQKGWKIDEKDV